MLSQLVSAVDQIVIERVKKHTAKAVFVLDEDALKEGQDLEESLRDDSRTLDHALNNNADVVLKVDLVGLLKQSKDRRAYLLELRSARWKEIFLLGKSLQDVDALGLSHGIALGILLLSGDSLHAYVCHVDRLFL